MAMKRRAARLNRKAAPQNGSNSRLLKRTPMKFAPPSVTATANNESVMPPGALESVFTAVIVYRLL
jgi:hypothetical protein